MSGERVIKLRRPDTCASCGLAVPAGAPARWDASNKTVTCLSCTGDSSATGHGVAGASARATGEQQAEQEVQRRADVKHRQPTLGRLRIALEGPSAAGDSYLKGAVGEEKLGASLDQLRHEGLEVLHDRRRPRTAANIDHLVVAPSGVWVIDAKRYQGQVSTVDHGGWFRTDIRLMVAGHDQTRLVAGVHKQVADVQGILTAGGASDVLVRGVLCFVDAEWKLFAKPFEVDGVLVCWGKVLRERLASTGPLDEEPRAIVARLLLNALPPARP